MSAPAIGAAAVEEALRAPGREGSLALVPFLTAGYPRREGFADLLLRTAAAGDVVELGVPFTDPMADGVTIQRASREALAAGVSLGWILELLDGLRGRLEAPVLLMSYLNPLLARGLDRLPGELARSGVSGLIVPDLPLEEGQPLRAALAAQGLALVQMVTPVTPPARARALAEASRGFLYAVTVTGITGGEAGASQALEAYLRGLRDLAPVPVLAGFGIRRREQVEALRGLADGAIVGTALIEALERGEDPAAFLGDLRPSAS